MTKTRATFALGFLFLAACSRGGSLSSNDTASPASPASDAVATPSASSAPAATLMTPPMVPPPPPPPADGTPAKPLADSDRPSSQALAPSRRASPNAGMPSGVGGAFDRAAAAHALASVDLSGCGATPGSSGHVTVTFSPDGTAKSEIDTGAERASEACIRSRYDAVRIPSFDSPAPIKTGKDYHIPGL